YNITIRPAGGEGRIEIILPTGGTHRAKRSEDVWSDLLKSLHAEYLPTDSKPIEVGRGRILELADLIQSRQSESLWQKKLFDTKVSWNRLIDKALDDWAKLDNDATKKELENIKVGDLDAFTEFVISKLQNTTYATTRKAIQAFIKR